MENKIKDFKDELINLMLKYNIYICDCSCGCCGHTELQDENMTRLSNVNIDNDLYSILNGRNSILEMLNKEEN